MKSEATGVLPHSRLFVVYGKASNFKEEDLKAIFGEYGTIEDVYILKDRNTDESKGMAYIKFLKFSEAAIAMESLNNVTPVGYNCRLGIQIARHKHEADDLSKEEWESRLMRLFVSFPKGSAQSEVEDFFKSFGPTAFIKLVKDKETDELKGFGFVTYTKISSAAHAVEACEESGSRYKAVIARINRRKEENQSPSANGSHANLQSFEGNSFSVLSSSFFKKAYMGGGQFQNSIGGMNWFHAAVSPTLTMQQLQNFLDLIPGFREFKVLSDKTYGSSHEIIIYYEDEQVAQYAFNKLDGFEYPIGERISVKKGPFNSQFSMLDGNSSQKPLFGGGGADRSLDLLEMQSRLIHLTKAFQETQELLKMSGAAMPNVGMDSGMNSGRKMEFNSNCNFPLPPAQNILSKFAFNEETGTRLYFVGKPTAPHISILNDVFCRFGNFAGANIIRGKNYGYAHYIDSNSAARAVEALNNQVIGNNKMSVMVADPRNSSEPRAKRPRTMD